MTRYILKMTDEERHKAWREKKGINLSVLTAVELQALLLSAHRGERFNVYPSIQEISDEYVRRLSGVQDIE